ncbi:MAG: 16S rRNA (guanine(966)-N(2))-methyltransferase RsmD [Pseudomonadota bacterium]
MIKVTGGELRGRNLRTPPGLATRPTAAKVRQAIFNILAGRVAGARAADLFAGSGALGIEALSRGAAACVFVEEDRPTAGLLGANLAALGLAGRSQVIAAALAASESRLLAAGPFDLILADPPYGRGQVEALTGLCARAGMLAAGGVLVIEHAPAEHPAANDGLALDDRRAYGQTEVSFLSQLQPPAPPAAEKG